MVDSCSAINCTNRNTPANRLKGISFHRFPRDQDLRQKWILATKRAGVNKFSMWDPSDRIVLCSKHFAPEDFKIEKKRKILRKKVVPSIFEFTTSNNEHLSSDNEHLSPNNEHLLSNNDHSYSIYNKCNLKKRISSQKSFESDSKELRPSQQKIKKLAVAISSLLEEMDSRNMILNKDKNVVSHCFPDLKDKLVDDDKELSQFWYDAYTADILARASLAAVGENGKIACVSCPSTFVQLKKIKPDSSNFFLFEYDKRFQEKFPDNFIFYDYNQPLCLGETSSSYFDMVLADPPYLSKECLEKTLETVKYLAKNKVTLCTGSVMEELVKELYGLTACSFIPKHMNNLGNEFRCYTNWDFDSYYNLVKLY